MPDFMLIVFIIGSAVVGFLLGIGLALAILAARKRSDQNAYYKALDKKRKARGEQRGDPEEDPQSSEESSDEETPANLEKKEKEAYSGVVKLHDRIRGDGGSWTALNSHADGIPEEDLVREAQKKEDLAYQFLDRQKGDR